VDGVGDDQRLGANMAPATDLEVLGVEPQVGKVALKRPGAKRLD